jgi:polyisoprenoid-binding protein YceI
MKRLLSTVSALSILGVSSIFAAPTSYLIDTAHSTVEFSVQHMVLSKTKGGFSDYTGTIVWDASNPTKSQISGAIMVNSIDTKDKKRDEHLKSKDFFDAESFPKITLTDSKIEAKKKGGYQLTGKLTIKGVTKEIVAPLIVQGPIKDPWGNDRIHFNATFSINRQDYGITWNKIMDNGGVVVGNQVNIEVDIEAIAGQ